MFLRRQLSQPSSLDATHRQPPYVFKYLTPHKILILILIHVYCSSSVPGRYQSSVFGVLLENIEDPSSHTSSLKDLEERLGKVPSTLQHKSVYDVTLEMVWSLSSIDEFHTFMMSLSIYLAARSASPDMLSVPRPILTSSILGRFIRKCRLEYIALDFQAAGLLWDLFKALREQGSKNHEIEEVHVTVGLKKCPHDHFNGAYRKFCTSLDDIEKLCKKEIERLESGTPWFASSLLSEYGDPDKWGKTSQVISAMSSRIPCSHFIQSHPSESITKSRFRNAVLSGDYFSAVGHIHSFFDYTITTQLSPQEPSNSYQFPLLHLAILHEQFHHYSDSAWAIREAINAARENKDNASLLFSLAWLHQFAKIVSVRAKKEISISGEESLQYLKTKTKEANLPLLLGTVNLIEAQQLVRSGGSLVIIFVNVLRASHVNVVHNLKSVIVPQMTFQSALWSRLGNQYLSSLYMEICLEHHAFDSVTNDVMRIQCMRAHQCLREGRIRECFDIFDFLNAVGCLDIHAAHLVGFNRAAAELRLALNRKCLADATSKLAEMKSLQHYDSDTAMLTLTGEVDVYVLQGDGEEALGLVREKFQSLNETEGDVAEMLYLMLLHGRLLLKLGKPAKALSILIRCVDLSEKYNHRPIYLAGVGLLAKVMNEFDQYEEAYRILSSVMQYIIETNDRYLRGLSYLTLAESLLSGCHGDEKELPRIRMFLGHARKDFQAIQDVDGELSSLCKLALVLDGIGDTENRDIISRESCELEKQYRGH